MQKRFKLALINLALLTSPAGFAATPTHHVIVAPTCLIKAIPSINHQVVTTNRQFALIKTDNAGIDKLIEAKQASSSTCGGFMDVTTEWEDQQHHSLPASQFLTRMTQPLASGTLTAAHYKIQYSKKVLALLAGLNPQSMWSNLTTLTNYNDRYANSDNGVNAANWIKSQLEKIAADNQRDDIKVYTIKTGDHYKQPSVIMKIGTHDKAGVVISAHMDTLNGQFSKKPGADDDGSGTATVLETARNLIASGMKFKKPIYFMWFAAEEEGLVGSDQVVSEFKAQQIPVDAVLHFDMTGYAYKNQPDMWLMQDYVNSDLTAFIETLIKTYVKKPVQYSRCGYACSDHATWTRKGYAAAIAAEAAYENTNPAMHSSQDTMDKLSIEHMTDYAKLASAFAVEMATPV